MSTEMHHEGGKSCSSKLSMSLRQLQPPHLSYMTVCHHNMWLIRWTLQCVSISSRHGNNTEEKVKLLPRMPWRHVSRGTWGEEYECSRPACFTSKRTATGTHWTEDCVGANVRLDVADKRKSLVPAGNRSPGRQSSHYTAWANLE
jgi:hypothetical protein